MLRDFTCKNKVRVIDLKQNLVSIFRTPRLRKQRVRSACDGVKIEFSKT